MDEPLIWRKPHRILLSVSIGSFYPPPHPEVLWMTKVKAISGRKRNIKDTGLYCYALHLHKHIKTLVSTSCLKKLSPTCVYLHGLLSVFISHTCTPNSHFPSSQHTNHRGSMGHSGCNLSGVRLITALLSAGIFSPKQHLLVTPDLTSHLLTRETMLLNNFSSSSLAPFPWPLNPWHSLLSEGLVCVCQPQLGSLAFVPLP